MKTNALCTIAILTVALLLMSECKSKTKPSGTVTNLATEAVADGAAGNQTAEPDADNQGRGPLEVRSGIVEYTYSGDKTGKSTQYFDDYGVKSAVYAEIVQQGEESKGWAVTIGEDQYMWNLNSSQGMKAKNPMAKMLMDTSRGDIMTIMADMYGQMGMHQSGTEMFQGKECAVFKGDIGKVLIWKGLMMMMEMKMGDILSRQEVTSIKTNLHVDGKYFRVPDNINFNEIPGF